MAERVYQVETPESFVLTFERGGFASRAVALGIDTLLMASLTQTAVWLLSPLGLLAESVASALWIVIAFLVQWGYGALSEWRFAGRTVGKRLTGLAVVDASGLPLSFSQAAVRNLLRVVDLLPGFYLLGATTCLLDRHGRRLGDLAARTLVVRAERAAPPAGIAPRAHGEIGAWVGPVLAHLRDDERAALLALSDALGTLALADRVALCNKLLDHLLARHQVALPGHLSAERALLSLRDGLGKRHGTAGQRAARAQES